MSLCSSFGLNASDCRWSAHSGKLVGRSCDCSIPLVPLGDSGARMLVNRRDYGSRDGWREIRGVRISVNANFDAAIGNFSTLREWSVNVA